jgi:hypothetical protein
MSSSARLPITSSSPKSFTRRERALIARLSTPSRVQAWLNALKYNNETGGETLRSFRPVARLRTAHCLEAALFAAVVLEQHGYPPLLMSLESQDNLDHVIFVYRDRGRWGSVARSRDPGLHGRKPVFPSVRALARSYIDPYVDYAGRVRAFGVANLVDAMPGYDWRYSEKHLWKVEQMLIDWPHKKIKSSTARYHRLRRWYRAYRQAHNDRKPTSYRGREKWEPLPKQFRVKS